MTDARPAPLWAGRTLALVGIILVAINLRTAVGSLSPILDRISADIPLSAVIIGIIGAAPPIVFAASGLFAPPVATRLGLERSVLIAVGAMIVGSLGRALAPNAVLLLVATIVTLVGVGTANILLPPIVKRYFPDRVGLVTTLYVTLVSIGAATPALTAVPVADSLGWRTSLGMWAVLAVTAAAPWVVLTARRRRELIDPDALALEPEPALAARIWRAPVAWAIAITFAVSTFTVYACFAWLPSILIDTAGVPRIGAGALLSLYAIMGFPAALLVPVLAARMRNVSVLVFAGVALLAGGFVGLVVAPGAAPVFWVVLVGLGPLLFPLALVLINSRTRTHAGSIALSGFVQGIGYVLGALGPLVVGILHQATGEWTVPLIVLVVVSLGGVVTGLLLARPSFLEDELAARAR